MGQTDKNRRGNIVVSKKIGISVDTWEDRHNKQVNKYAKQIDDIFSTLSQGAGIIGASVTNFNQNKAFSFTDYPNTKQRIDKLLGNLQNSISLVVNDGTREEWLLACMKNDSIVKNVFNNQNLSKVRLDHYYSRNLEALDAFQKRKVNGLGLSDRVWNITQQTKQELEMSIDLGLTEGKSAAQMSREIKKHLNDPDKLFRRVRNSRGNLQLSKNAKAYHPGQGVYRSSKANAMRLTRTETNIAYRASDNERWNQLEFILGYEIKRSNNPYPCPVCEALKGKYPKTFKFVGWHPNCRCFQVPILADLDEFMDYEEKILNSEDVSEYRFKDDVHNLPDNFTEWVNQNSQTLSSRKSVPYFIRDNFKNGNLSDGLKYAVPKTQQTKSKLDEIIQVLDKSKIDYNEVKLLDKQLNESEIIERVGGGDMTKGSCSSLAFAYAGNKSGFEVFDFRDGLSREQFSRSSFILDIVKKSNGAIESSVNDFTNATNLLKRVESGKEYYFTCGKHAAIVRKTTIGYEYLELQSSIKNGFKPLTTSELKDRFGAKKSHSISGIKYETEDCIIDIELLKNDTYFKKLLGYINTKASEQKKGTKGTIK